MTALMYAAKNSNFVIADCLLRKPGCSASLTNKDGKAALDLCTSETIRALIV